MFITRSNIRSLARGRDAEAQIEEYRAAFDARTEDMLRRIQDAEARLETAVWVRREAPMATLVHAVIPDAETLERLAAFRDDEGVFVLRPAFSRSENRRRLTLELNVPPDQIPSWAGEAEALERMQAARADAFSDYRIAVAAGTISDAAGFRVAGDRRSAVPAGSPLPGPVAVPARQRSRRNHRSGQRGARGTNRLHPALESAGWRKEPAADERLDPHLSGWAGGRPVRP